MRVRQGGKNASLTVTIPHDLCRMIDIKKDDELHFVMIDYRTLKVEVHREKRE